MDPTSREKGGHAARRCVAGESNRRGGGNRGPREITVPLGSARIRPMCFLEEDGLPPEQPMENDTALGN